MATVAAHLRPYEPKPQQNTFASFLLAVMMHALLVGALWISVQWQLEPQGEIVAELWGALPEPVVAALPPPPPPPTVEAPVPPPPVPQLPDPDIALEQKKKTEAAERLKREEAERLKVEKLKREEAERAKAEQRKRDEAERQKAEKLKREQIERQRAEQQKREEAQLEAARKAEEARMLAQAGAAKAGGNPNATASVTGSGRGDPNYAAQLISVIRPRIVFAVPEGTSPSVYADYQVDLLPTGEILSVRLLKASGLPGYDAAVERAIRRTDPFPRKRDGTVDRTVTIRFRPVDAQ